MRKARSRSLCFLHAAPPRAAVAWQPQADIYRSRDGWVIKLELAGVRPEDVTVTVQGTRLRVDGIRHDWLVEAGWNHYAMEIAYNRFERTVELPCDLERARITVECRHGMLLLHVVVKENTDHV